MNNNICKNIFRGVGVSKDSKTFVLLKKYIKKINNEFGDYESFKNNFLNKKFIINDDLLTIINGNKYFRVVNGSSKSFYFDFNYVDFEKVFIDTGILFSKDNDSIKKFLPEFLKNEKKYLKLLDKLIIVENGIQEVEEIPLLNSINIFNKTTLDKDKKENILIEEKEEIINDINEESDEEEFSFDDDDDLTIKKDKLSYTEKEYEYAKNILNEKEKIIKDLIIFLIDKDKLFYYQNEYFIKNIINEELLYILKNKSINDDEEFSFSFDDEDIMEVSKEKTYTKQQYEFIINKINDKKHIIKEFIKFLIEKNMMNKEIQSLIKIELLDILNS